MESTGDTQKHKRIAAPDVSWLCLLSLNCLFYLAFSCQRERDNSRTGKILAAKLTMLTSSVFTFNWTILLTRKKQEHTAAGPTFYLLVDRLIQ